MVIVPPSPPLLLPTRVLYFSIHRYEHGSFWPNLRESNYDYIGQGDGRGFTFNVPLNTTGMTNHDFLAILHQVLLPVAYEVSQAWRGWTNMWGILRLIIS